MKVMSVTLAPWKWQGAVLVGGTPHEFQQWGKKFCDADLNNVGAGSAGHAYVEYGKPWLIWVESLKNIPTLAHEAFHVTAGVLEGRGLKYSAESEEAYTYTMEALLREVLTNKRWRTAR